jgi:hypothetical protein
MPEWPVIGDVEGIKHVEASEAFGVGRWMVDSQKQGGGRANG